MKCKFCKKAKATISFQIWPCCQDCFNKALDKTIQRKKQEQNNK